MDMQNNKRRNVLTHARVNFSQSETSLLLRGGELNFELLLWGRVNRKDPKSFSLTGQSIYTSSDVLERITHPGICLTPSCMGMWLMLDLHFIGS